MSSKDTDFDALMVDWLYDELDPQEAKLFEEELERNPALKAEATALKRTREAFADQEELEPPNSLTAIVMHEAALHAKDKSKKNGAAAGGGLWASIKGFFEPIAMHPAASAFATLVLVAGVAGALYVNKGDMVSRPTASSPSAEPAVADKSDKDGRVMGLMPEPGTTSNSPAPPPEAPEVEEAAEPMEGAGYAVDMVDGELERKLEQTVSKGDSASSAREQRRAEFADEKPLAKPARSRVLSTKSKKKAPAKTRGNVGVLGGITESNVVSGADLGFDARGLEESKDRDVATAEDEADDDADTYRAYKDDPKKANKAKPKEKAQSWEEQRNEELIAFARNKDCLRAGEIANDIFDRNADFYVKRVKNSAAVKSCQQAVAREARKRRARTASKRAKKKAGNAAPAKAKAAPQPDEAAQALD